jgi:hypothetical protein
MDFIDNVDCDFLLKLRIFFSHSGGGEDRFLQKASRLETRAIANLQAGAES